MPQQPPVNRRVIVEKQNETTGAFGMHNLAVNLERSAALFPQKTALYMGNESYSYAQLDALASKVAHNLVRLGLKPEIRSPFPAPTFPTSPSPITAS